MEYLKQADEIKVEYRDKDIISDLTEKYPQAKINLALPYSSWANEEKINWTEISFYKALAHDNFILGIINSAQLQEAKGKSINVYHRAPLHTFQELYDATEAGINEAFVGAPLFFQLDKIKKYYPDLKIRSVANVALPEGSISYNSGVCGVWIRPEDVELYESYIETIEFFGELSVEQALFRIYAQQHAWPGELNKLVKDLNHPAVNRMIPHTLAEARISCEQKCMENGICHLCQRTLDLANPTLLPHYSSKAEDI